VPQVSKQNFPFLRRVLEDYWPRRQFWFHSPSDCAAVTDVGVSSSNVHSNFRSRFILQEPTLGLVLISLLQRPLRAVQCWQTKRTSDFWHKTSGIQPRTQIIRARIQRAVVTTRLACSMIRSGSTYTLTMKPQEISHKTFLVRVPPEVISLQRCTPRPSGV
jgi:hypothetical protein